MHVSLSPSINKEVRRALAVCYPVQQVFWAELRRGRIQNDYVPNASSMRNSTDIVIRNQTSCVITEKQRFSILETS
jgi:hypothetical protein